MRENSHAWFVSRTLLIVSGNAPIALRAVAVFDLAVFIAVQPVLAFSALPTKKPSATRTPAAIDLQ